MNDFRPDWIGAVGAGIAALISLAIAKRIVKGEPNQPMYYLIFGACTIVLSLAIRELLRLLGL